MENSIAASTFSHLKQLLPATAIQIASPAAAALLQMQVSLFLALIAGFPIILYHLFLHAPLVLTLMDAMAFLSIAMGFTIISGLVFAASAATFLKFGGMLYRLWMNNRMYALPVFVVIVAAGFAVAQSVGTVYTDVIKNRAGTLTFNVPNASGTLSVGVNFTRFNASDNWTKPSGVTVVIMVVIGAGGAGGNGGAGGVPGGGGGRSGAAVAGGNGGAGARGEVRIWAW